jgi:ferredoxin-NADP reductase
MVAEIAPRSFADGPRGVRRAPDLADNAVLVARDLLSPTVARLVVRPDDGVAPFVAGQYLALGVRVDDRIVQRPYSTASDPAHADAHEFLVRHVPDGALTPRLWALPVGSRVRLGPPKGAFTLATGDQRAHLFVATGTGIAPFLAMLRTLARRPHPPRTILVHGAARTEDLVCGDDIAALAAGGLPMTYVPTVSRPDDPANRGWQGRTGRAEAILASVLESAELVPGAMSAYLCGNPGMVAAAEIALLAHGLAPADIHAEKYWTASGTTA